MAFVRNYSRYSADVVLHRSLDAFLTEPIHDGINVIDFGHTLVELRVINRNAATTVVIFHAAANLAQTTLPLFTGEQLTDHSEANVVFVSDPSLERGSSIGWFTGDDACPLQTDLVNVLSKIQKDLNAHNLIFMGPRQEVSHPFTTPIASLIPLPSCRTPRPTSHITFRQQ